MTPNDALNNLGRTIRRLRELSGLSRRALAVRCGLAVSTIKNAEHGSDLRLETLVRIAEGLGLTVAELLEATDPRAAARTTKRRALDEKTEHLGETELDLVNAFIRVLAKWSMHLAPTPMG